MASGKNISNEGSHYRQEEEYNADISGFLVDKGAIVKASSDMGVQANEKERCAISVHVTNESAVIYVSADVGN